MIKILRLFFIVAAVVLFGTAISLNQKLNEPEPPTEYSQNWGNDLGGEIKALEEQTQQSNMFRAKNYEYEQRQNLSIFFGGFSLILFVILNIPWSRMASNAAYKSGVVTGKFINIVRVGVSSIKEPASGSPIVGRHGLSTYSIADELAKWNQLREDGVVTEKEFAGARARLLNRDNDLDLQ
ncbi:SHOCT domain-containing protein [Novosphingobium sp. Chol11]|uniref:SHOCT domain-containing protein n=1 Tax=Novosphingobium sp. Chol11 TaxID=1385763 RepID=UPI0025F2A9BD|nr:SHOCT domain-containing protein [Novosphingobium sp. Chol11]